MFKKCLIGIIVIFMVFISIEHFKIPYLYDYLRWIPTLQQGIPTEKSLPNPVAGQRFIDSWHSPRSGGRKHEGVDIFAPRGTPIRSTTSGLVVRISTNKLGGKVVSIMTGRTVHYYAHLEDYGNISRHQWIEQGEIIGTVGDSGNAKGTPPHLHYGIYTPSGAINPYPLIKQ
ncbi:MULTISPECIES: M23 family metallopeptidase [unclassified Mannheimia]|uniref:M23 family metallopeptidase n=1 Tax=unclassified Mannheimia TaxID=2645054 RepID=UPI00359F1188